MTTLRFAASSRSPFTVEIEMLPKWADTTIKWEGELVGEDLSKDQLQEGVELQHDDGRILSVILPKKTLSMPEVRVGDQAYILSVLNHHRGLKNGVGTLLFLAVVNILISLYAFAKPESQIAQLASDPSILFLGLLFLGLYVWSRYSPIWPLGIGAAVWGICSIMITVSAARAGVDVASFQTIMRIVFLIFLINGFRAARTIKTQYAETAPA